MLATQNHAVVGVDALNALNAEHSRTTIIHHGGR